MENIKEVVRNKLCECDPLLERYGGAQKERGFWFHGTSAKNLPNIVKKGLVYSKRRHGFGSMTKQQRTSSVATFDKSSYTGVYFTTSYKKAFVAAVSVNRKGSNYGIVVASLQPRSLLADEDDFVGAFIAPIIPGGSLDGVAFEYAHNKFTGLPSYPSAKAAWVADRVRALKSDATSDTVLKKYQDIIMDTGYFVTLQREAVFLVAEFIKSPGVAKTIATSIVQLARGKEKDVYQKLVAEKKYAQAVKKLLPTKKKASSDFRAFIDQLTRIGKDNARAWKHTSVPDNPVSARSEKPIGYTGKNKIVVVLQAVPDLNAKAYGEFLQSKHYQVGTAYVFYKVLKGVMTIAIAKAMRKTVNQTVVILPKTFKTTSVSVKGMKVY